MALKSIVSLCLIALLTGCGIKGDLKRPSEIEQEKEAPKQSPVYGSFPLS